MVVLAMFSFLIAGCADLETKAEQDRDSAIGELKQYDSAVTDAQGRRTVADSEYFRHMQSIASRYNQSHGVKVFGMMATEAEKYQKGLPSEYADLKRRWEAGDKTVSDYAEVYDLVQATYSRCQSFGYKEGTPDYNKCVYDMKLQLVQLYMQQQALIMQQHPTPTYVVPPPLQQKQPINIYTECNKTYGGVACRSTGQ